VADQRPLAPLRVVIAEESVLNREGIARLTFTLDRDTAGARPGARRAVVGPSLPLGTGLTGLPSGRRPSPMRSRRD